MPIAKNMIFSSIVMILHASSLLEPVVRFASRLSPATMERFCRVLHDHVGTAKPPLIIGKRSNEKKGRCQTSDEKEKFARPEPIWMSRDGQRISVRGHKFFSYGMMCWMEYKAP